MNDICKWVSSHFLFQNKLKISNLLYGKLLFNGKSSCDPS